MAEEKSLPDTVAETASAAVASAKEGANKLAGAIGDSTTKVTSKLAESKDRLTDTTGKLADRVADTRDKLADTTSRLADRLNETGSNVQEQTVTGIRIVRDNPLGLVLSGLAIGFLAGVMVPVTDVERERIAPLRDEILDRAQRAAGEVVQHGRSVFEETAAAAGASASKHGQALAEDLQTIAAAKRGDGEASPSEPAA